MYETSSAQHGATNKPRIVDDLISVILESNDHWWPRDFQRLALVSPGWLGPIRRRLYACPSLRTFHACNLFVRTITENPHVLTLVRGIDLRPVVPVGSFYSLTEQDMTSIRLILSLKGLQTVALGGELAIEAERFIQMMSNTRTITSLHIDGSDIEDNDLLCWRRPASLEWNETIAFRFTGLKRLQLTSLQLSISDPPLSYALRIADIVLNNVSISQGSVQHLCHESWEWVRSLAVSLKADEQSENIVRDLLECCTNLESLQYESCGSSAHGEMFEEDIPLPKLHTLRLYDVDINPQTLLTLDQTCKALEHLSLLGRMVRLKPQDWKEFLHSGALPSLRQLCIPFGTNEPPSGFSPWPDDAKKLVVDYSHSRRITLYPAA